MFSLPTEKILLKSYVCEARNLQMKPGRHKALKKEINVCLPPQKPKPCGKQDNEILITHTNLENQKRIYYSSADFPILGTFQDVCRV